MTEQVNALLIVFAEDVPVRDVQVITNLVHMLRNVIAVERIAINTTSDERTAHVQYLRAKKEIEERLWLALQS